MYGSSKWSFSFGNSQKLHGAKSGDIVDGPVSLYNFLPKTPGQRAHHEQGHCHDARSKHQAKVRVFSDKQPHVTLPIFPNNNADSLPTLFKKLKVNNFHLSGEFSDVQFFHCLSHLPDPL
jgi:hypothetical protein